MVNRSSTAVLSPVELSALRRVADGRTKDDLAILFNMGLAALDQNGFTNNRRPAAASCRARRTGRQMSLHTPLSAGESDALRRVGSGLAKFLPTALRTRLASLGLITITGGGRLVLTQGGKEQLAEREVKAKRDSTGQLR